MASIRYLGHSCFEIKIGGKTVLTDPWLNPKPEQVQRLLPPALTCDQIKQADMIFVSHLAYDHCDNYDISTIVNRTFAQVIAPEEVLGALSLGERYKVAAVAGDYFHYFGIDVEVLPVRHAQADAVSYMISAENKKVYFAGDTYDFYGLSQVSADVAIVPIGGSYTMDVLSAVTAVKKMSVKHVIPCHYNTFAKIRADPHEFAARVKKETKAVPVILSVGQAYDF